MIGNVRDEVHGDALASHTIEVAGEVGPVLPNTSASDRSGHSVSRPRAARLPRDIEGDALPDLALGRTVRQKLRVGVRVQVDEARGDDQASSIDDTGRVRTRELTDRHDTTVADPHVGVEPRISRTVDDAATPDHKIVARRVGLSLKTGRNASYEKGQGENQTYAADSHGFGSFEAVGVRCWEHG